MVIAGAGSGEEMLYARVQHNCVILFKAFLACQCLSRFTSPPFSVCNKSAVCDGTKGTDAASQVFVMASETTSEQALF